MLGPLILAPFAGLLALLLGWRRRTLAPLLALLAGGLLTAFIWAPMIPEQAWVRVEHDFTQPEAIPAANPLLLADLLAPPAVYDTGRGNNNMGDRAGLGQTILLVAAAAVALVALVARRGDRRLAAALLLAALAGLFLFWLLTGWLELVLAAGRRGGGAAALSHAADGRAGAGRRDGHRPAGRARARGGSVGPRWPPRAGCSWSPCHPSTRNISTFTRSPRRPTTWPTSTQWRSAHRGTALTAFGDFTPLARTAAFDQTLLDELGADFDAQARPLAGSDAGLLVRSAQVRNQAWDFELTAAQPVTATLHLLYYPRWQARLDGQPVPLAAQADTGYVQVAVPAGEHTLALRYGPDRVRVGRPGDQRPGRAGAAGGHSERLCPENHAAA